ncbi:MAG: signal peptidase II [Thiotrichaceae bacterium]
MPNALQGTMLRWTWVSAIIIFLDQLTKWMAEVNLTKGEAIEITPFLNMTLWYNEGAAFSFLAGQGGWQRWFFAILAFSVSLFILNWLRTLPKTEKWTAIGLALVLGGAIGNLIDRVLAGKVIDFIDFHFPFIGLHASFPFVYINPDYHFATFNVADIGISIGAALLIIMSLFSAVDEK